MFTRFLITEAIIVNPSKPAYPPFEWKQSLDTGHHRPH